MAITVVSYILSKKIREEVMKENIRAPGHVSEKSAATTVV